MQYTVDELYDLLHERVNAIRDVFNGFFGEDYVDMQNCIQESLMKESIKWDIIRMGAKVVSDNEYELEKESLDRLVEKFLGKRVDIYVWWPRVTVTNENDKSVVIQDLYAKINVQLDGRIPYENHGFLLNRATYTQTQFLSDYMHSHVNGIPKGNYNTFQPPCLGSGPIRDTIVTLKNEGDEVTWMLFCQELAMYVTVESLTGIPYRKLEEIGGMGNVEHNDYGIAASYQSLESFTEDDQREFIKYYLTHGHLSIGFRNGEFKPGMPYHDYIIDISNSFIDFYNESLKDRYKSPDLLFDKGLLRSVIVFNGRFYGKTGGNTSLSCLERNQGQLVLTFKGKEIRTHIILDEDIDEATVTTLVNHNFAMCVLHRILKTINYRYRNGKSRDCKGGSKIAPTCKKVTYL